MRIAYVFGMMLLSGKNYLLVSENLSENSFLTVRTYCSTFNILDIYIYYNLLYSHSTTYLPRPYLNIGN